MSGSEDEGAAAPPPAPLAPAAPVPVPGELTIPEAVKEVLKNALIHGGLARGLHECTKALDKRKAVMCFLAKNCEVDQYTRLVEALCKEHKIRLMKVDDRGALGEWAGLCRLARDGKAKKIVNCNCVVVTDVGHSTPALEFVMKYFESKGFSTEMSYTLAARHTPHRVTLPSSLRSLVRPPVSPLLPSLYYGYQLQGHTLLLGCARLSSPDPLADPPADWSLPAAAVLSTLPLGVCIVGLHLGTPPPDMPLPLEKLLGSLGSLPTLVFPNNRLVLSHLTAAANDVTYQLLDCSSGTLSPVSVSHEPISLISSLVDDCVIKLELKQEVKCDISHESFPDSFSTELSTLRSFIQSQPSLFSVGTGSLSKSKCKSISIPFPPSAPSKAKRPPPIKETLSLKKHVYPLSLSLPPPTSSRYILPLHYHIWASADLPHTQLDSVLRDGLVRYLDALCDVTRTPSLPPCYISICHIPHPLLPFLPLPLPNPHTDLPNNSLISPLSLSPLRQTLSALLLLPPTTPYLFSHRVYPLTPLHLPVPHLSLPASPAPCCSLLQTVSGLYDYYHYLSDGVDDCGWGCAYRSLQTIFSWYVLQGYVRGRDTPPSHLEAQEILVAVGDKPASFPHSREWIGSVEVGLVLQDMLSVQHKILHLSSREELPDVARQLLHHFERWGTPVMMGGGQLAHTLLGVAYDESMGTCQLLVLDPHYRGPDDIRAVLKGGWCAWRGVSFWKPNTFYNLCLPLRDFID